ncbi:MAG: SIS domain-containing protein, partial [Desulfomonilaceae bacterium]
MCGIAGFLSSEEWKNNSDVSWVKQLADSLALIYADTIDSAQLRRCVDTLINKFDDLMKFSFYFELAAKSDFYCQVEQLAVLLEKTLGRLSERLQTEEIESLRQDIEDSIWQIRAEVLQSVPRTFQLINSEVMRKTPNRAQQFVAWAIEKVLENIDRLEVRGRDSAGIAVQLLIDKNTLTLQIPELSKDRLLTKCFSIENGVKIDVTGNQLANGDFVLTFVYKVANLVGHLGDNTKFIRRAVTNDEYLWNAAQFVQKVNMIAHTRWASNGIISLANCHPVDGELYCRESLDSVADREAQFVLNGDVDNYHDLLENLVHSKGYQIDPAITTDAKILPVFYRLGTSLSEPYFKRFSELMNSCDGSLAIVMQHPLLPETLVLGQKGSGQSLFIG